MSKKNLNAFRKIGIFITFDKQKKKLLIEATFYLLLARVLKQISFKRLAPTLGMQNEETTYELLDADRAKITQVSDVIHIMSDYAFWESACLVKAIAAMKMLAKRGIESTLYLGTAKDEQGKLIAHAWLRSGTVYVTGSEEMRKFTVVGKFASKKMNRQKR